MDYNKIKNELNSRGIFDIKAIRVKSWTNGEKIVTILCILIMDKYYSFKINKAIDNITESQLIRYIDLTVEQIDSMLFGNVDTDKIFED